MKPETLQKRWAGDARRDELFLRKRAKEVLNPQLRQTYEHEANIAHYWWLRRLRALKKHGLV